LTGFGRSSRLRIVTGASKGIGKGIASVFCRTGGKVLVVSRHAAAGRCFGPRLASTSQSQTRIVTTGHRQSTAVKTCRHEAT
jgi:NAD(P)-dependent dehydrogenase (short-subunit alcohol dehydrogenase family)